MMDESTKALRAAMAKAFGDRHAESRVFPRALPGKRSKSSAPIDRLVSKLVFGATDCWYFAGSRNRLGYGALPALGESKAHRVSWRIFRGDIPAGMSVLHRCDVRNCVNPDHLFLGTQADNVRDMYAKGRAVSKPQRGSSNPMARLTESQVATIREQVASGATQRSVAAAFAVSPMTVSRIVRNETWTH